MKAYTDLEQSKKLAEILPLESADGFYEAQINPFTNKWEDILFIGNEWASDEVVIPAWSLAALLAVLPTTIGNFFEKNALRLRMDKGENDFNIWYENFDCGDVAEGLDVKEDNPVDACYKAIIHLHEQKLL